MKSPLLPALPLTLLTAALVQASEPGAAAPFHGAPGPLEGTWTLVAADLLLRDGTRTRDYGEAPAGRMVVDAAGRYSVQIYRSDRPRFASPDKARATPAEFESAMMGCSTHFGLLSVDPAARVMTLRIEHASFPNWEGTEQVRHYALEADVLTYQVPARADGNIPLSVWRRVK